MAQHHGKIGISDEFGETLATFCDLDERILVSENSSSEALQLIFKKTIRMFWIMIDLLFKLLCLFTPGTLVLCVRPPPFFYYSYYIILSISSHFLYQSLENVSGLENIFLDSFSILLFFFLFICNHLFAKNIWTILEQSYKDT